MVGWTAEHNGVALGTATVGTGRYTVVIQVPGYGTWQRADVDITRDGCGFNTARILARLQRAVTDRSLKAGQTLASLARPCGHTLRRAGPASSASGRPGTPTPVVLLESGELIVQRCVRLVPVLAILTTIPHAVVGQEILNRGSTALNVSMGAYRYINAPAAENARAVGLGFRGTVVRHLAAELRVGHAWTREAFVCPLSSAGGCGGGLANARRIVAGAAFIQAGAGPAVIYAGGGAARVWQSLGDNNVRAVQPVLELGGLLHLRGPVSIRGAYRRYYSFRHYTFSDGYDRELEGGVSWRLH